MPLTTEEQLRITNSGRQFQETGANSWVGVKVRKTDKCDGRCDNCEKRTFNNYTRLYHCKDVLDGKTSMKFGVVISDMNGAYRSLTVRFEDGTEELIEMNNLGPDPEYIHQYEWLSGENWYRF